ncbi:UTP--glucose-1-phosphate uridylyltransferase [Nocardioides sp.]|jgi:UTP--glucose-1-phosphate uridylyltransferase|uniref:UTP--glucose-1-phosphate uridylyltransferase n=1 Tax=Nocardioides sp. TaxID=35761 RepID=UPI0031FF2B39|nr:UTP--glucose-phosphate uridylyltransferase [Nocardioides sp.]
MNGTGLSAALAKMREARVPEPAVRTFERNYRRLVAGETGLVPESSIVASDSEPVDTSTLTPEAATRALDNTVVIKLNGGLGTSMGINKAKSLLTAKDDWTFLDVIVRQVLQLRRRHDVRLPLMFMNSFRTRADTLAALAAYPVRHDDLPLDFLQTREPRLRADDLTPLTWEADPSLEWCPPGHGDFYGVLHASGLLEQMIGHGFDRVFVSNADNLGAVPTATMAGWFAASGAPFAIEAVRRTASDRKGGHFARRKSDGRLVLRETAQTAPEDHQALADLDRHRFASTNNIWIDLRALRTLLDEADGALRLPFICNRKSADPADPSSPRVVQIESAIGAAIENFEGARTVEVSRSRFIPVKTTDDLLVLRSDCYTLTDDFILEPAFEALPFVELGPVYKQPWELDRRFPWGAPGLRQATALRVAGDWTFGRGVRIVGACTLDEVGGTVPDRAVLGSAR